MKRSRGNHLSETELALLADMLEARADTASIAHALNVSDRTVQRHRDAFYARLTVSSGIPGTFLDQCRDAHARLRRHYKEALAEGDVQHAGAIGKRMDEWKKKAKTAANYERRAREAA